MCLGPELLLPMVIGGALSAGGKMIEQGEETKNAESVSRARNAVLADTLLRNDRISDETRATFANNQKSYTPEAVNTRQQDEEASRVATGDAAVTLPSEMPITANAPEIVKTETAKRMSQAIAKGKERVRAGAKLGSFGDQWFKAGLGTDHAGRDIALKAGFANQNLALLPHLQDFAENKAYKPISPIGGMLMGAGNLVGSAAGSGYFKP